MLGLVFPGCEDVWGWQWPPEVDGAVLRRGGRVSGPSCHGGFGHDDTQREDLQESPGGRDANYIY